LDPLPHKKVLVSTNFADVVTGNTSLIAAKTKEYEFDLCGHHDIIPPAQVCDGRPLANGRAVPD